jgi:DNA-binding NarL/FixJ family response regulator
LREKEILSLLAKGLSDKQAAQLLGLSDLTVRKHRRNLLDKAEARNICALLLKAFVCDWIPIPEKLDPPASRSSRAP